MSKADLRVDDDDDGVDARMMTILTAMKMMVVFIWNAMSGDPKKKKEGKRALHSLQCGCASATY